MQSMHNLQRIFRTFPSLYYAHILRKHMEMPGAKYKQHTMYVIF